MSHLTLSQLEQYLSKAAWILKGPIGASDFKAYIFPMHFFQRISDVYDEEYQQSIKGDLPPHALKIHRLGFGRGIQSVLQRPKPPSAQPGMHCSWCQYRAECIAWRPGMMSEAAVTRVKRMRRWWNLALPDRGPQLQGNCLTARKLLCAGGP